MRRFGTWELFEPDELAPYLAARLGPEPLGPFSAARLGKRLDGRRAPLKSALLDQRTVAGLGNIYVDEALWRSRLHPLRVAGSLDGDELGRLYRAIRNVLRKGSSARDRRSATTLCPTAPTARCRTSSAPTDVGESRVTVVGAAHADRRRRPHDHVLPALPDAAG